MCFTSVTNNVYSAVTLPATVHTFSSAFICNTDPSALHGKHWIVFWLQDSVSSECYDSFGYIPQLYNTHFDNFLRMNMSMCIYNNNPFQNKVSSVCGYYVLYYLLMKCNLVNLYDIVDR